MACPSVDNVGGDTLLHVPLLLGEKTDCGDGKDTLGDVYQGDHFEDSKDWRTGSAHCFFVLTITNCLVKNSKTDQY